MREPFIEMNGNFAVTVAADVISHFYNDEIDFLYYCDIVEHDYIEKCSKATKQSLLHEYIESVYVAGINFYLRKHYAEEMAHEMKICMDSLSIDYSDIIEPTKPTGDYDDEQFDLYTEQYEQYADQIQERFNELALPSLVNSVFSVLYNNKNFLYDFNLRITEQVLKLKKADYPDLLEKDGKFYREAPPNWLKVAVFHRDHGRCQCCGENLDRIFLTTSIENYDHIIPLNHGGSNDPTNYQLMCEHCNKSKSDKSNSFRNIIWPYWDTSK